MDKYIVLRFESNNKFIEIGNNDCKIISIEGLSAFEYDIDITNNNQYHGGYVKNKRFPPRSISIKAEYTTEKDSEFRKDNLINFFNPGQEGILYINLCGKKRKIAYQVQSFKDERKNLHDQLIFKLELMCPEPFFMDIEETEVLFSSITPLLEFPIEFPEEGLEFSRLENVAAKDIINDGHVASPIRLEFIANGVVENPYIQTSNLEKFKLNITLQDGDRVIVTTGYKNKKVLLKRVSKEDVNGIGYIDFYESDFIHVPIGESRFTYGADDGVNVLAISFKYSKMYLGV